MGKNKVLFGLEKVYVAFKEDDGYAKPVHIPGAVNMALNAEGETNTFYADNIAYFAITSNNGYTGDLEMALIPDDVLAEMMGWEIDENGMLVEIADGKQKEFALLFEVSGNENNKRYVYYNCTSGKPNDEHETKGESTEPTTSTLTLTVTPTEIDGKKVVRGNLELSDTNEAAFNAFYDEVLMPKFGIGGGAEG